MNTISFPHPDRVRVIAHRGLSGIETENTCAAFTAAGNRSYFGIETDVHVTADGEFVVIHDDNTRRVALEDHVVEESSAAVLRSLTLIDRDSGEKTRSDLKIPLLTEYTRICRKYEKTSVLELKNPMDPAATQGIVEEVCREGWLDKTIFISFCHENLTQLRRLLPEARLQFLTQRPADEELLQMLLPWRLDLDIHHPALTQAGIELMHAHGVEVNCWTVDEPDTAARLASWGVDYITSNILE